MSNILSDPSLELFLPLTSATLRNGVLEDLSGHGRHGTPSNITYAEDSVGRNVASFNGSTSDISFDEVTQSTVCWRQDGVFKAKIGAATYWSDQGYTTSFTIHHTTTALEPVSALDISYFACFSRELTAEELSKLEQETRYPVIHTPIQEPRSIPADITNTTLVGNWLTKGVEGTALDRSNAGNDATSITGHTWKYITGAKFASGNFVIPSTSFAQQRYTLLESDGYNRYVKDSTTSYKNGIAGATLPLDITATGFTNKTLSLLRDVEVYTEDTTQAEVTADYQRRVADNALRLSIYNDRDISRFNTSLTFNNITYYGNGRYRFTSGGITWPSVTLTSYCFWWNDGSIWKFYATDGTTTWANGVSGATLPITITATGFSGATGTLSGFRGFLDVKDTMYFEDLYKKERLAY